MAGASSWEHGRHNPANHHGAGLLQMRGAAHGLGRCGKTDTRSPECGMFEILASFACVAHRTRLIAFRESPVGWAMLRWRRCRGWRVSRASRSDGRCAVCAEPTSGTASRKMIACIAEKPSKATTYLHLMRSGRLDCLASPTPSRPAASFRHEFYGLVWAST